MSPVAARRADLTEKEFPDAPPAVVDANPDVVGVSAAHVAGRGARGQGGPEHVAEHLAGEVDGGTTEIRGECPTANMTAEGFLGLGRFPALDTLATMKFPHLLG